MKINEKSLISRIDTEDFRNYYIKYNYEVIKDKLKHNEIVRGFSMDKIFFFTELGFRKLVFSDKSRENLFNYKISKDIRFNVLRTLPNRKDIIQLDKDTCIRYIKTEKDIKLSIHYTLPETIMEGIGMFFMKIDLVNNKVIRDQTKYEDDTQQRIIEDDEVIEKYYGIFMLVVTYLELTPVTLNIILGGARRGNIMKLDNINNQTKLSIIQVNTNWNTRVIRIDSFTVRGHWRLQPYGSGLSKFKYIYIDTFEKGLLRRKSQKECVEV